MSQSDLEKRLREQLDRMWGAGIDYALSPDFKELTPDEKDALYDRYKTNIGTEVIAELLAAIKDAGYINPEQVKKVQELVNLMAQLRQDMAKLPVTVREVGTMTGAEWEKKALEQGWTKPRHLAVDTTIIFNGLGNIAEIPGYHGKYWVTESGDVYSIAWAKLKKKVIQINNQGYASVMLAGNRRLVHRLVAQAFIPNPDNKSDVNHIDADTMNNHVSNLEWNTRTENMAHATRLGLFNPSANAYKNKKIKLSDDKVAIIKRRLLDGESGVLLAKEYGVAHGRIYDIKHGRAWPHVEAAKRAAGIDEL